MMESECSVCHGAFSDSHKHKGLIKGMCSHCYTQKFNREWRDKMSLDERATFLRRNALSTRERATRVRLEALSILGGCCACCGETEPRFLCFDHINGGGRQERLRGEWGGYTLYRKIIKSEEERKRFRVLCYNCNEAVHRLGYCPHGGI